MLEEVLSFAWYGGGGVVGDTLAQWEQMGFFSYLLPFLLLFALIFGILTRAQIFKDNKPVNAILSLVVALMALQFDIVPRFFAEIFPRLGAGLAIILVALILIGMFMQDKMSGIMFGLGAVVFLVVLYQTAGALGWSSGFAWSENWVGILTAGLIIFGVIAVIGSIKGPSKNPLPNTSPLARALRGD